MKALLVSTYELGHQPLHLASPAAFLREAGHEVRCLDVSVEPWDPEAAAWADVVAFSVPMHTATRMANAAAAQVRRVNPDAKLCFYGLYALAGPEIEAGSLVHRAIAGEYERGLVDWMNELEAGEAQSNGAVSVDLGRQQFIGPDRQSLPSLDRYALLEVEGETRLAGYVEASHGCVHRCRHCPVPVIYDGRMRVVQREVVLEDVAKQVELGARHITFGDPDFLNGPRHSLEVVREMHRRFSDLTFDCTVKVEHVLHHASIWPEMSALGCLFVVSAFECLNDAILERLDKGHTAADAARAVDVLRRSGIEVRPSFMPFTPWTRLEDVVDILDFVEDHELIGNVDPVQYTIRLLVPKGSLLLGHTDMQRFLGPYDAERLSYRWRAADSRADELQARLARLVERDATAGAPIAGTFRRIRSEAYAAAGRQTDGRPWPLAVLRAIESRPRLTEPWFC